MPLNIEAVVTDIGRQRLLEGWGQTTALDFITSFKVGEGGWENTPGGQVPRDPTDEGPSANRGPTLTDLDCIVNPSDYPVDSRATFSKALALVNFAFTGNTTLEATCYLDFGEFNNDGYGNFPEMYEIGLFNSSAEMVAYGTFPRVEKNPGVSRTFTVKINADRS
jgi:hypothetical protein